MDKLKTRVLFISLIILALLSVSAVAATDADDVISANQDDFDLSEETITDVEQTSADAQVDDVSEDVLKSASNDPLTAGETASFSELQELINGTDEGSTLELDSDYAILTDDDKPIIVNKTITIDGKGHTLDAKNLDAIMSCLKTVTLKNIVFKNAYCTDDYIVEDGYNIYFYGALNLNPKDSHDTGSDGSVIDNCTFEDNEACGGAAIYIFSDDCTVSNSRFENNKANDEGTAFSLGGAIVASGDNCKIQDSNFTGNTAVNSGGAIFVSGDNGQIEGCNFTSNEAGTGGAVEYLGCNHQKITDSYFSNNKAKSGSGGAVHAATSTLDDVTIDNCVFEENDAKTDGGAIYLISNGPIDITNSKFYNNTAKSEAGAIYVDTSNLTIENDEFINNSANSGGAVSIDFSNADSENINITIANSQFIENTATFGGGAVYTESPDLTIDTCQFEKNDGGYYGGAIDAGSVFSKVNVTKSNFIDNEADYYGGAVYCLGHNSVIDQCIFVNNTIEYQGGAVYTAYGSNIVINNSKFYDNNAKQQYGGAAFISGPSNIIDNCEFNNNTAPYGGAMWISGQRDTVQNSQFNENNATARAGAIYVAGANLTLDTVEFKKNTAPYGGAIYTQSDNLSVNKATFEENNATDGGAIYAAGAQGNSYNLRINDAQFNNNNATRYGGAMVINIGGISDIDNSVFKGNKAFNGSAIYHNIGSLSVSNTELLENQANSTSLTLEVADINKFDVLFKTEFKGQDNLLNAINTNNGDVTLSNVKYHGFEEEMTTGSDITPVASADESNDGAIEYIDAREAGINITVCVFDENDNFLFNITDMTDIYGNNSAEKLGLKPGKYKAYAVHEEDAYYTYIKSETIEFEVERQDVIVTVDRVVNYTGAIVEVIANVTDADGNPIDGGTATFIIHYDNKIGSGLLMASSESYTAEVVEGQAVFKDITLGAPGLYPSTIQYSGNDYYNSAENESEVEVLPLNTTTSGDDVSGTAGDKKDITADIVDQNGNPVKNGTAVLKVNGKEYTAEVKDGKATFKGVELPDKSTPATIEYLGNDYYNPSNTTIQITVTQPEEPTDEPSNETEDERSTPVAEKAVPVIPAAGNPIALVVLALLTLVSTVSLGRKK